VSIPLAILTAFNIRIPPARGARDRLGRCSKRNVRKGNFAPRTDKTLIVSGLKAGKRCCKVCQLSTVNENVSGLRRSKIGHAIAWKSLEILSVYIKSG